ncbi:type II toxin-antitoxin system HicB family antitoxin [Campylobacter fetus]|uniref:type II toxin-antitoxin system HicB family antitoxin n=1 Tax=Campylobacter fetus TaxID=196 RepID=UPI00138DF963|nr:type II toxin-antitoxin system HicB family antitoxin [Campylobacter fetus]
MKDLNYYLNLPYTISIKKLNDGDYFAEYSDINLTKNNLIAGWGKNEIEAINDLKDAFACYVEGALKDGDFIPEPLVEDKKVRINITLPKSLIESIDKITKNRSQFLAESANLRLSSL